MLYSDGLITTPSIVTRILLTLDTLEPNVNTFAVPFAVITVLTEFEIGAIGPDGPDGPVGPVAPFDPAGP
jgi:hypothetical protein